MGDLFAQIIKGHVKGKAPTVEWTVNLSDRK